MSHMQAQMTKKLEWLEVDGPMGTEWVMLEDVGTERARRLLNALKRGGRGLPRGRLRFASFAHPTDDPTLSNLGDYFENREIWDANIVKGYGVRSSAPGYMDATPYSVYTSLREAQRAYAAEKRAIRGED